MPKWAVPLGVWGEGGQGGGREYGTVRRSEGSRIEFRLGPVLAHAKPTSTPRLLNSY